MVDRGPERMELFVPGDVSATLLRLETAVEHWSHRGDGAPPPIELYVMTLAACAQAAEW